MNILMLTSSFGIGGAETHILALATEAVKRGHTVTVMSAGGELTEKLTERGIMHLNAPFFPFTPRNGIRAGRLLSAYLATHKTNVVHAHSRVAAFIARNIVSKYNIPLVVTAHAMFSAAFPKKQCSVWGERTLAVSEDIRELLIREYGLYPDNVRLTVNGIDRHEFAPASVPAPPHSAITVSRLDADSSAAAEACIRLTSRLLSVYPDFTLTVVGNGTEYDRLHSLAEEINHTVGHTVITMPGAVRDVAPLLQRHSVFIGSSRAALEALLCGLCVVLAGNFGYLSLFSADVADVAIKTNFCFRGEQMFTKEAIFQDVHRLFSLSETEKTRLRETGRAFVTAHYSTEKMFRDAESVYTEICRPHNGKRACLVGYYGYSNLGDDASLRAAVSLLRRRGYAKIIVFTRKPRHTRKTDGTDAVFRYNPFSVLRQIRKSDFLFFGGGTLLQDKTSRRSLSYYTLLLRIAARCGTPYAILAGGIGTLSEHGAGSVKQALAGAAEISVRTPKDLAAVRRLTGRHDAFLLPDLAFFLSLSYAPAPIRDTVLFSIRPCAEEETLLKKVRNAVNRTGISPVFCILSPEDRDISRRFAKICGGSIAEPKTPETLAALLSSARVAWGMRLHFLIFALRTETPFGVLHYDEKGVRFADFVNETLQKSVIPVWNPNDKNPDSDIEKLLTSPPDVSLLADANRKIRFYFLPFMRS